MDSIKNVFLRAPADLLVKNRQGAPGLWRHGISGDRAIVLLHIHEVEELPFAQRLLLAHTYWRLKGLDVDLVILNSTAESGPQLPSGPTPSPPVAPKN